MSIIPTSLCVCCCSPHLTLGHCNSLLEWPTASSPTVNKRFLNDSSVPGTILGDGEIVNKAEIPLSLSLQQLNE